MIRIASQLLFCSPNDLRRSYAIELNDHQIISNLYDLRNLAIEVSNTLFFDGIISPSIVSLKKRGFDTTQIPTGYHYLNLITEGEPDLPNERVEQALIIDFGSEDPEIICRQISQYWSKLSNYSLLEIIDASSTRPATILGFDSSLEIGHKASPLLWQGIDLVAKKISAQTTVTRITSLGNK